jgi:hypothetical protein
MEVLDEEYYEARKKDQKEHADEIAMEDFLFRRAAMKVLGKVKRFKPGGKNVVRKIN